ncbi:MAG TPA: ComF family protein [Negativicutes bacterium]|nr:ComF family protein [Negativicutes bacterium]
MIRHFLDLLYPKKSKCDICCRPESGAVCSVCMAALDHLQGSICIHCGKQLVPKYAYSTCPDCRNGVFHYERAYSCFDYSGVGKLLVHKLKYEGKVRLAGVIAELMKDRLKNEGLKTDAIVPVPIHENKLLERGYNQSLLIARELGKRTGRPVVDCLVRTRDTKAQYNLDRTQRHMNILDAFSVGLMYNIDKYKSILLVDDVYTTGSTSNECSRVLKQAGAGAVYVITAATGSNT